MIDKSYSNNLVIIAIKMSNDNATTSSSSYCYWLCNRKAELKVYTDFGNILHLCCYNSSIIVIILIFSSKQLIYLYRKSIILTSIFSIVIFS